MRFVPAMRSAELRQSGAAGVIAVLNEVAGILGSARGEVDNEHGLDVGEAAPVDEFVGAESIGFGRLPGVAQPLRSLLDGADAILPSISRDEVSAGILDDRGTKLLDEIEHVAAKPALVCGGVARLVDAAIDAAPEMLDEGAKQAWVGAADGELSVEVDVGLPHQAGSPSYEGSMQRAALPCNGEKSVILFYDRAFALAVLEINGWPPVQSIALVYQVISDCGMNGEPPRIPIRGGEDRSSKRARGHSMRKLASSRLIAALPCFLRPASAALAAPDATLAIIVIRVAALLGMRAR
jgi:hypothetical protein